MASCSSHMSEEQLWCSICLDVFIDPVTNPCGHNFCKACITTYWDRTDLCLCPLCLKTFDKRPDLFVNTTMSELAAHFRNKAANSPDLRPHKPEVSCDSCIGKKCKALRSCLVCQTSYCEAHLEPHLRVGALKRHKLILPVENLMDRVCKKHDRPLELFCRTDQTCVCQFCTETDHKIHDTVPLKQECEDRKIHMKKADGEVQQMIHERQEKVWKIKLSVETSKRDTERELSDSVEVFTALVHSIERRQVELIQMIEEKQNAMEMQAEGFIQELEQEIIELKRRSSELELMSHTDDHLLLQNTTSLETPPVAKDWSAIWVHSDLCMVAVRLVCFHLKAALNTAMENLAGVQLKRIQRYAVDVSLDMDTAHPNLILSEDEKGVSLGDVRKNFPDTAQRFDSCPNVLGKQSFSSGRFYYEVLNDGKTQWDLGVVRESINRKGKIPLNIANGYWTLRRYLSRGLNPQKVGVFVDYEKGHVSFYDVDSSSQIHCYTGCTFRENLYPFFSPGPNFDGKNSARLRISYVKMTRPGPSSLS